MNTAGMIMMGVSYVVVLSLTVYCFYRVLTTPDVEEREHAPIDIDTRDKDGGKGK